MSSKGFLKIIEELNYPPIYIVPPAQFAMIEGEEKKDDNSLSDRVVGIAAVAYPIISIHPGLKGKERDNVIYHEIAHHLWPWRPHWCIEAFGEKMARGGGKGAYCKLYGHSVDDLPPRSKLLQMARRQSEKLKIRYRIKRLKKRSQPL